MLNNKEKEMRREYLQAWRKKNPNKVKQYNETYWKRKAKKGGASDATEENNSCND